MAKGYPDFWQPPSVSLPTPTVGQVMWRQRTADNIAAGGGSNLIEYEVVTGEVLFVTGIILSSDFPCLQKATLMVDALDYGIFYWDTSIVIPLSPSAIIQVDAGETFKVWQQNIDDVIHAFSGLAFGFRVTITAGATEGMGQGLIIAGAGTV